MSINTTTNLHLPQWTSDEKPSWLTEMNQAFSSIDTAYGDMKALQQNATNVANMASSEAAQAMQKATTAEAASGTATSDAQNAIATANNAQSTAVLAKQVADKAISSNMPVDLSSRINATDPNYTNVAINKAFLVGNMLQLRLVYTKPEDVNLPVINTTLSGIKLPSAQQFLNSTQISNTGSLISAIASNNTISRTLLTNLYQSNTTFVLEGWVYLDQDESDRLRAL